MLSLIQIVYVEKPRRVLVLILFLNTYLKIVYFESPGGALSHSDNVFRSQGGVRLLIIF